jgi:hypothetical protein
MIIVNIITTVIIPLIMFMIFFIYIVVVFLDYGFGKVRECLQKIGRIIHNLNNKRKDKR